MQEGLEQAYGELLAASGDDRAGDGLRATPARAAEAFAFLTSGYRFDPAAELADGVFPSESDEMVAMKDIELYSLCEHHLLPFFGHAHVAYVPGESIVGFSKIARIVDGFAHRLQVQERLTAQIAGTLMESLGARGVGVVIEARHLCVAMRGVRKQNPEMRTSCMLGTFRTDSATRAEFLDLIR
jgi:GTP cyclohydrolase I